MCLLTGDNEKNEYLKKRRYSPNNLNLVYHFGLWIADRARGDEELDTDAIKEEFGAEFAKIFNCEHYLVAKALIPEIWTIREGLMGFLASENRIDRDAMGKLFFLLYIFERSLRFKTKIDMVYRKREKIYQTSFYYISAYSHEVSALRTLLIPCLSLLYRNYTKLALVLKLV